MARITEKQKAAFNVYLEANKALVEAMQPITEKEVEDAREIMRDWSRCISSQSSQAAECAFESRWLEDEEDSSQGVID